MSRKWLIFLISGLTINMVFTAAITAYFFIATKNVEFNGEKLKKSGVSIEYFNDGDKNVELKSANSGDEYVKITELKSETKNAFVAIEDKRFYNHDGLDYLRMIKAAAINAKSLSFKEGASTISQQLIKNTHLSSEKTLTRKLKEIKLTKQMEKVLSKNEILESYLNIVYFGKGCYGIASASKTYFNKKASELTLNESAALAATIKSPKTYSPINEDNCFKRKNLVLSAMNKQGYIGNDEYAINAAAPITVSKQIKRDAFADYITAVQNEYETLDVVPTYLEKAKVKIYTYLDEPLQKHISELTVDGDNENNFSQIVINNKNASVIAFYGKNSNLARCPASTIKPLYVYAPLIDSGKITESTVLLDEPTDFSGYAPKNYGDKYNGNVTVKTAILKSLNVPAVKLLNYFGCDDGIAVLNKAGVAVEGDNLSSALGSGINVTLKKLSDLYASFSSGGEYTNSAFIKKIEVDGKTVYERKSEKIRLYSDSTAYIINDALKDCAKFGTAKKLRDCRFEVCAKTGTNGNADGNIDAYCVGYTSRHTVGVWYGNDDASLMPSKISGGTYPAIRVKSALNELYKNTLPENFDLPDSVKGVKIDEVALLNEEKTYLTDDKSGKVYYYAVGTEPTEYAPHAHKPQILNYSLSVGANETALTLNAADTDKVTVYKILNGKKTEVYCGEISEIKINGNLNGFKLEIVPYNAEGAAGESVVTPVLKYVPKEWWND